MKAVINIPPEMMPMFYKYFDGLLPFAVALSSGDIIVFHQNGWFFIRKY